MMRDMIEALSRLVAVFRRRALDGEFDDEFAAHLDLLTTRNEQRGLPRHEARRQAILQLGGLNATRDLHREARGLPRLHRVVEALGGIRRDLVHAADSLRRAPGFTAVCVTSLSIGMGVVIAIPYFSRLLFAAPAGVKSDGLIELLMTPRGQLMTEAGGMSIAAMSAGGAAVEDWSYPDYRDLRDAVTGLAITGWTVGESVVTIPAPDRIVRRTVPTMFVSTNYFRTVGVALARGPGFDRVERGFAEPVVVLGYGFWQNRLSSDPDIVGKTLILDDVQHVVVGVAPDGYCWHLGECPGTQLFVPLERHPRLLADEQLQFDRRHAWVRMHGRLAPDVTIPQANAAVSAVMSRLAEELPATNRYKAASVEPYFAAGAQVRSELMLVQGALLGLAGMVLLVVCLNISGMMQVRNAIRERELSIRQAIGASRARLVRYLLCEAILLASVGGVCAALLLFGTPQALARWFSVAIPPHLQEALRPNLLLVAIAVGLCLATSLAFGLLPAIRFSRPALVSTLKDDAGGGGRRVGRIHRLAAALQVGIAIPFLVVSGALMDWVRTSALDLRFEPEGLAAIRLDLNMRRDAESAASLLRRVREELEQASGVQSVTIADAVPLDFQFRAARVSRPGQSDVVLARPTRVSDAYLETLGISLLRGRDFTTGDAAGTEPVAMVSKLAAQRLFGAADPIGERLTIELEEKTPSVLTIVGVTDDFVGRSLDIPRQHVLVPLAQHPASSVFLVARSRTGIRSVALTPAFRNAVRDLDPDFTNESVITGDNLKRQGMEDILVPSAMVGGSGGIVLTLAALGIYGVIGFMVATRRREIAVRVAMGASRRRVLRTVQADVVRLVIPGVAGGLFLAIPVVRLTVPWRGLAGAAMEPAIYALGVGIVVVVALLAALPAARRAASVDPMVAMRSE